MGNKNNWLLRGMVLAAAGMFTFAAVNLAGIYLEYRKGTDAYDKLQEYVKEPEPKDQESEAEDTKPAQTGEAETEEGFFEVDFDGLKAQNPDVAAWIQIPALEVSYPVVKGEDNEYYLHHMFDGQEHKNGSIFIDHHNQADFTDHNTIIYGHNMKNGSMFGTLSRYQEESLYREYPYFYIYVPGYVLEYQVFSCYAGRAGGTAYTYRFPEMADFESFLETIRSYSGYDTGVVAGITDKIVTLSTCVNTDLNYRYLVHGKLVQKTAEKGRESK